MFKFMSASLVASTVLAATITLLPHMTQKADASTFVPWETVNLEWNDVLKVREQPNSNARVVGAIVDNSTAVSLTGTCTNGINVKNSGELSKWEIRKLVRYEWCQIVRDTGEGGVINGWVYGRYIQPR